MSRMTPATPLRTQLVFDCADPHPLAAFWAEALHYEHEEIDGFIRGMLDAGTIPAEITTEVDGKLRWRELATLRHPDDPVDDRGAGTGRRLLFQAVPEQKTVKNRLHLDLEVGPDNIDAEVAAPRGPGRHRVSEHDDESGRWILMTDPEGNELDVS